MQSHGAKPLKPIIAEYHIKVMEVQHLIAGNKMISLNFPPCIQKLGLTKITAPSATFTETVFYNTEIPDICAATLLLMKVWELPESIRIRTIFPRICPSKVMDLGDSNPIMAALDRNMHN
jgi:hypothetical protein